MSDTVPRAAAPSRRRRRRRRRRLLLGLAGLLLLVWALPPVLARSPALGILARQLGERLHGRLTIGGASLGWFSPVVLRDLELHDAAGRRLAAVAELESEQTLLRLLWQPDQPGTLKVRRPVVEMALADVPTDFEELFAAEAQGGKAAGARFGGAGRLPQMRLEIEGASLKLTDGDGRRSWSLHDLGGAVHFYPDADRTLVVNLDSAVHDGSTTGSLRLDAKLQHLGGPDCRAEVKGKCVAFPLAAAGAVARRLDGATELSGYLDGQGQLSASLHQGKPRVQLAGEWSVGRCQVDSPLLEERLALEQVQFPCRLQVEGNRLRLEQAELSCDLGKAALTGEIDLTAGPDQPGLELTVRLDLARAAEKLPRTLRLHHDLRVTAGHLNLTCRSAAKAGGTGWDGRLQVTDLQGRKGTRPVAWTEPVLVVFQARELGRGVPLVDQLHCSSRFLRVDGAATPDGFALQFDANLQQLMEPLGEFVDLGELRVTGQAHGRLGVRRQAEGRFVVDGDARLDHLDVRGRPGQSWQEDTVTLQLAGQGRLAGGRQRLDAATASLRLGADTLDATLLEAIDDLAAGPGGLWELRGTGELARWQQRGLAWGTLPAAPRLAGAARLQARLRPGPGAVDCPAVALTVRDAQCLGSVLQVREPEVTLQTTGRWLLSSGLLELGATSLRCPALTLEAARCQLQPATLAAQGSAVVRGDVARLKQWLQPPGGAAGEPLSGSLAGRVDLDSRAEQCALAFDLTLDGLTWGPPARPHWQEPRLQLSGQGHYEPARATLHFTKLHGASQYLAWDAQGRLADLPGAKELQLAGRLSFDLQQLEPHLRPYLGKDGHVTGSGARPFTLGGPLAPRPGTPGIAFAVDGAPARPGALHVAALKGEGALSWQSVRAHGCEVGPAELRACLQQGWFQLYPVEAALNGGKLHLQPNVRLEPGPAELILLAGPVVENARLTRDLCDGALGFVVPGLAGCAEAEGLVSLALEGARLPLAAPATGEVRGTLQLHAARVGPGPLTRELAVLLREQGGLALAKEARVPFHMVNGRVHHKDLELNFPGLKVRSSGSVGLDGSLALVLEMPVPAHLFGTSKLTGPLANRTIRLPVGGTRERPQLDTAALRQLNSQLTNDAVREQVEKGLQRLLRPRGEK